MRLKRLELGDYKNLVDFKLELSGASSVDLFVGPNGSGKSNLFEAIIQIFQHLYEFDGSGSPLDFDYVIEYEIDGQSQMVSWSNGNLRIGGKSRKRVGQLPLPDHVLIYYSGHNELVENVVSRYQTTFQTRIKDASFGESRQFFGIGPAYKDLLMALLLVQKESTKARQLATERLEIVEISDEIRVVLGRPFYASNPRFDVVDLEQDRYWKPEGVTKDFLDLLSQCVSHPSDGRVREEGYFAKLDTYILYLDISMIRAVFDGALGAGLFRQLDNLKVLGMLKDISLEVTMNDGSQRNTSHFSDGQFQSIYVYAMAEFFIDRECLVILDEPDSFLHPSWQFQFMKQLAEITLRDNAHNHVLISTHSASTLAPVDYAIHAIHRSATGSLTEIADKADTIKALSAGLITISETEVALNIENSIQGSAGAMLFTEGPTDEKILTVAWEKLFPMTPMNFSVQNAFDRSFLRNLFSRAELAHTYPGRPMFALFDFDDAVDDWRNLKYQRSVQEDPMKGLCRELRADNHFAMLLPVPDEPSLVAQVLDAQGTPWKRGSDCHLSIELLFYPVPELRNFFVSKPGTGGAQIVEFVGAKVQFAESVVPNLEAKYFEVLRPMLEFVSATSRSQK